MKKRLILPVSLAMLLALVFGASAEKEASFAVHVEQNDSVVSAQDGIIKLKKAPFRFEFTVSHITLARRICFYVAASSESDRYLGAIQGAPINAFMISGTGGAEGYFNEKRILFVGKTITNVWYYDSDHDNRFDIIKRTEEFILFGRSIENILMADQYRIIPVSDYPNQRLYLVFVDAGYGRSTGYTEFQRECMIIEFLPD